MKRLAAAALVLTFAVPAGAAADDKPDPTGTWKWTVTRGDQKRDLALKLKKDGDKLTGTYTGLDGKEGPVEDLAFKDGEVAFKIVREFMGMKITVKYKGKVTGDTIKGKAEIERNGETQSRDWEAKREKS